MMDNAYVVGYGLIDVLGNNPKDCFANMLNDIDYSTDLDYMVTENHKITRGMPVNESAILMPDNTPKGITKMQRLAFHATEQALQMSRLPHSKNVAVLFSTIVNDLETLDELYPRLHDNKRVHPRMILNRIPDMMPSHIAHHYQFMGSTASVYSACATAISTIDYAMRLVDEYDYVVVGSGDAACFPFAIKSFHAFGAMGNHSCPFDNAREGFVMGDGMGVLILQSKQKVKEYGSHVYATLYPAGISNDAYDATSPAEDGRGAKLAFEKAMKNVTGKIHAVNAHATSTPIGDVVEYNVVTDRLGAIPIYAPKSKLGHTMAGCGMIETIYAIESMRNGVIPHIHNLNETSIDKLNCLARTNIMFEDVETLRTINNSFGFGGKCASQVVEVTRDH